MYGAEYSHIKTGSPLDQTSAGSGTSGPGHVLNSGSAITTQACELISGYCELGGMGPPSFDSPWNERLLYNGNSIEDFTVSSTGTYALTGSLPDFEGWVCMMSTFRSP